MHSVIADTHTIIWYFSNHSKLSNTANTVLNKTIAEGGSILVSAISLIEIIYLIEKGRLPSKALASLQDALQDSKTAIELIPIDLNIAAAMSQIKREIVPDMPDRIIAATALSLNLPLVTRDSKIQQAANIQTIW